LEDSDILFFDSGMEPGLVAQVWSERSK